MRDFWYYLTLVEIIERLSVCLYVHPCSCPSLCVYAHVCMCIRPHVCMCVYTCTHVCTCTRACMCICVHVLVYYCMYVIRTVFYSGAALVLSIIGLRLLRGSYTELSRQHMIFIFTLFFFNFDYEHYSESLPLDYFVISLLFYKVGGIGGCI